MNIVGIDAGNRNVKVFGVQGALRFTSKIGEYRERTLETVFSEDDMVFEYQGKKGFAGTLAEYESEFANSFMGDSKAHSQMVIRTLLGLHRYFDEGCAVKVVVGQPVSKHNTAEKQKIIDMLRQTHEITINRVTKQFEIEDVMVAAEGGAAFWSSPKLGLVRVLDFGSGTVNAVTLLEGRYIDKDSFTMKVGMETNKSSDVEALVELVAAEALKKWNCDDFTYVSGGATSQLIQPIGEFFFNAKILRPQIKDGKSISLIDPIFGNAVGNYNIGRKAYGQAS